MSKPYDKSTHDALTGVIELITRGDTSITTISMAVVLLRQYRQEIQDRGSQSLTGESFQAYETWGESQR